MLISPAYAQDIAGIMGAAQNFVPLLLIFGVFYFLLIRPQQTRAKEMKAMIAALRRGDRVVTAGGIIGTVPDGQGGGRRGGGGNCTERSGEGAAGHDRECDQAGGGKRHEIKGSGRTRSPGHARGLRLPELN